MKADGSIIINTRIDSSGIKNGAKNIKSAIFDTNSVMAGLAKKVAAAFSVAAILNFSKQSSEAATQTEANIQRIVDIFGSASQEISGFIDANARAIGMSKSAAAGFSSVYGNLFSAWADQQQNAQLTAKYLQMTAVVASKTGRTMEDTQERIRSGLLGNTEAVEDLGIFVNVKTIEMTEAFQKLADGRSWEQLSANEQQQVRTLAILEQATNKYGSEVADTSTLTRAKYQAAFEDFQSTWGEVVNVVLLPVLKVMTEIFNIAITGIQNLFGFSKSTVDATAQYADNIEKASDNQTDLYKDLKKTNKELKKTTAGFDELNVLSSGTDDSQTEAVSPGSAAVGAATVGAVVSIDAVTVGGNALGSAEASISDIISSITKKLKPLQNIDLSKVATAFKNLQTPLSDLSTLITETLGWAYDNVLVPLIAWAVQEVVPIGIDLVRGALELLLNIIDALRPSAEWLWNNFLQPVANWAGQTFVNLMTSISNILDKIGNWVVNHKTAVENITLVVSSFAVAWGLVNTAIFLWNNIGVIATGVTTGFGAAVNFLMSPIGLVTIAIGALIAIVTLLINNWDAVKAAAATAWEGIKSVWNTVATWFDENICQPVANLFTGIWDGLKNGATEAWEGIKSVFSGVATFFEDIFKKAWEGVKNVFSTGGKVFDGIKDGIVDAFKIVVNALIDGINAVVSLPFDGLNGILDTISGLSIAGYHPFSWLTWRAPVPEIPHLAQGAVIPPNKEFLAVLGDQKNGTNIEAPLDTIKQALLEVMAETGGETSVTINFSGDLAQLARILKPAIETETRRKGASLAIGGTY